MEYDVVIIGAGASGLMCAVELLNFTNSVVILEANSKAGKKLLATGNGKCNLGNVNIETQSFHGNTKSLHKIIKNYPMELIVEKFHNLGVQTEADNFGRIYPISYQAATVQKSLCDMIKENNVDIIFNCNVINIIKSKSTFTVQSADLSITCKNLVIACGGKASPKLSYHEGFYEVIKSLGHSLTPLSPVLNQLKSDDKVLKSLFGVRQKCKATLLSGGKLVHSENGEVMFSEKGISGICIFNLSAFLPKLKAVKTVVELDFLEKLSHEQIKSFLTKLATTRPKMRSGDILNGLINMKLGYAIVKSCGINPDITIRALKSQDISKLVSSLKKFSINVKQSDDWTHAQITDGGVPMNEVDDGFQSIICPSLYFVGEILNVHGRCGGYNLYWAWASAISAADTIGISINSRK